MLPKNYTKEEQALTSKATTELEQINTDISDDTLLKKSLSNGTLITFSKICSCLSENFHFFNYFSLFLTTYPILG